MPSLLLPVTRPSGAPVHIGEPQALGIQDINKPDFGDPVTLRPGEIPVFWACGVTPQAAVMASRVPFAVSHARPHVYHRYSERRGNNKDVMCDFAACPVFSGAGHS
jgi:uncharacterized protein YcsI (UPF0317 family)